MDCKTWLKKALFGKDMILYEIIREQAKLEGFTKKQLHEARIALGVKTFHQIDDDSDTNWFWYLEGQDA